MWGPPTYIKKVKTSKDDILQVPEYVSNFPLKNRAAINSAIADIFVEKELANGTSIGVSYVPVDIELGSGKRTDTGINDDNTFELLLLRSFLRLVTHHRHWSSPFFLGCEYISSLSWVSIWP